MTSQLRVSGCPGRERSFRRNEWLRIRGQGYGWEFVLKKGSTGKFHFNLVAGNGQVIATSEAYESKAFSAERDQVGSDQRALGRDRGPDGGLAAAAGAIPFLLLRWQERASIGSVQSGSTVRAGLAAGTETGRAGAGMASSIGRAAG